MSNDHTGAGQETFETTQLYITVNASFMAGDFGNVEFPLALSLTITGEDALRDALAALADDGDGAEFLRWLSPITASAAVQLTESDQAPASGERVSLTDDEIDRSSRLLRDALGDATDLSA